MKTKDSKKVYLILLLGLIILIGFSLRLYHLDQENIWVDESFSLIESEKETLGFLTEFLSTKEGFPPGYPSLLKLWVNNFGNSEFSVRFLSLIFGVGSIILMYLLAASIWGRKEGLISALLISTSMLQILYSQEARPYALFGFLALLSTYFLVRAVKGKSFFPYLITTLVAFYVNYMTLFLIFFQMGIFFFKKYKQFFKPWVLVQTTIFVFVLPLLPLFFKQIFLKYPLWVKLLPKYGVPLFLAKLGNFIFLLPLFFSGLTLILAFYLFKSKNKLENFTELFNEKLFILSLFSVGVVYILILKRIIISFSFIRISYFMIPVVYLIMAKGITLLKSKKTKVFVILIILLFNSFTLTQYYQNTTKAPWESLVSEIQLHSGEEPLYLLENAGISGNYIFKYYYPDARVLSLNQVDDYGMEHSTVYDDLNDSLIDENDFWLITLGERNVYKGFLDKNYHLKYSQEYNWVRVNKYEKENN